MRDTHANAAEPLILTVFPGDSGFVRVYEDQGNSVGYQTGECAWTTVRSHPTTDGVLNIEILPVDGRYPGMPEERSYEVRLPGSWPPEAVTANGKIVPYSPREELQTGWGYDGEKLTTVVSIPKFKVSEPIHITVKGPDYSAAAAHLLDGVPGKIARLRQAMTLINNKSWPKDWSPDVLVNAAQTGDRISLHPESARQELDVLRKRLPEVLREIMTLKGGRAVIDQVMLHLGDSIGK
jgi:hypothetical protein